MTTAAAIAVACVLLGFAAPAQGAETAIADSEASTFVSPLWSGLKVTNVRAIVPYDVATRPDNDPRRKKFNAWLAAARARGASINVGLERINEPTTRGYGRAPDEATYRAAFRAFAGAYGPLVDRIGPWNEPNFNPHDGSRARLPGRGRRYLDELPGARLAAYYWRWAKAECASCKLIAGEFAGTQSSKYVQKYKYHLSSGRPDLWSVHNYSDVIRYQVSRDHTASELKTFLREICCTAGNHCTKSTSWATGRMWIGATGANFSLACSAHSGLKCPSGKSKVLGEASQCRAAAFINRFANVDSRITRIYFYTYMDGSNPAISDDTGIVDRGGTQARMAYAVVRDGAKRCAPPASPPTSSPAPAPAKDFCVGHPSDKSVVCVRNGGHTVDVCDHGADGHRAYARVITAASSPKFRSPFYDGNDSKSGCGNIHFSSRALSVAVCVQHEGCSPFKSAGEVPAPASSAPAAPAPAPPPPPAPAPAKDVCVGHPSDKSVVCVRNGGHTVDVCDRDADGHRAYARVITEASNPNVQSPYYDGNDSQDGCANVPFPSRVLSVAVCVQFEGCSAFKPT
ncbi:MAG: hypothetical protein ACR2NB_15795 [Solirubrobacteraceae bacterium]